MNYWLSVSLGPLLAPHFVVTARKILTEIFAFYGTQSRPVAP